MSRNETAYKSREVLEQELEELRHQLAEANETIEAIRTGQIDAIVVHGNGGHQLFTLKSADHTYRLFIEKMTEGAVTLNAAGLILFCNSRFTRMLDKPLSEIIGLPFGKFVCKEYQSQFQKLFADCWEKDCKEEISLISGEGSIPVQLSVTTLELDEGTSMSIILTDLTAQKKTQQQLSENNQRLEEINHALELSNHDLQQFASVASHDLQEPLRKIQLYSNLLKDNAGELPAPLKKYLGKIIDSSSRMKTLITDILNYSRLSSNDHHTDWVDLNLLIDDLVDDFELPIEEKKAKVIIEKLPRVEGNMGQLRQVFHNIISNALKFSSPGKSPEIIISSKILRQKSFESDEDANGAYCQISIRDNGIGFDEKYTNNIFDLFQRLYPKDDYEGTGIGLAIAKKIIDKHDGRITARSRVGEGAEFLIILPLKQ